MRASRNPAISLLSGFESSRKMSSILKTLKSFFSFLGNFNCFAGFSSKKPFFIKNL